MGGGGGGGGGGRIANDSYVGNFLKDVISTYLHCVDPQSICRIPNPLVIH